MRIETEETIYVVFRPMWVGDTMLRKKVAVLTALLVLSALIAIYVVGAAPGFRDEAARLAYVTKQTSSRMVRILDIPQRFLDNVEQPCRIPLPEDVEETVLNYVKERYVYKFLQIGFANMTEHYSYNMLILLSEAEKPACIEEINHIELVILNATVKTAREIVPTKVSQTYDVREEEWIKPANAEDEKALAKIVTSKSITVYEIILESGSLTEIEAWTTIEGKNIFGITLWSLTAKGLFGLYLNYAVLWIIDQSSAWANGWLGWWYENFSHYDRIYLNGLFGLVRAESDFCGPFGQSVHAWAWARAWYDGTVDGNAGT
ncbi:MAG: hypothetical protein QW707_01760 [Candidatus Bathyarchaeia archaeon]